VIDHHRRRQGAVAEAIHRLQSDRTIRARSVEVHFQVITGVREQGLGTDRLTRFRPADMNDVTAGRFGAKVVVERDDPVHFGTGEIQGFGNDGNGLRWDVSKLFLDSVQNGKEAAGHRL